MNKPLKQITQWKKIEALDCCDKPILRMRVKTSKKIKQQQQQTLITSKALSVLKNKI